MSWRNIAVWLSEVIVEYTYTLLLGSCVKPMKISVGFFHSKTLAIREPADARCTLENYPIREFKSQSFRVRWKREGIFIAESRAKTTYHGAQFKGNILYYINLFTTHRAILITRNKIISISYNPSNQRLMRAPVKQIHVQKNFSALIEGAASSKKRTKEITAQCAYMCAPRVPF
jgi:hypothetical protein